MELKFDGNQHQLNCFENRVLFLTQIIIIIMIEEENDGANQQIRHAVKNQIVRCDYVIKE